MSADTACPWGTYLDALSEWLDAAPAITMESVDELTDPPLMPRGVSIPTHEGSRASTLTRQFRARVVELEQLRDATGRQLRRVKALPDVSDAISGESRYLDRSA